jgi:DNA-binding NarL/FixJ family response regulator
VIRILIADDEDTVRKMVRVLLESRADFEVCGEADNGAIAIDKARELKPDLVILDISMPGVDGFEAARIIRKLFPKIRILIFSVHNATQLMKEAQNIGVNGFVEKSESGQVLLKAIDTIMADKQYFAASAGYG